MIATPEPNPERTPTGLSALDHILRGGLPKDCMTLICGGVGTGKTTIGLQFLLEGVRRGEPALYVTLLQSRAEVMRLAQAHGWSLDGLAMLDLPTDTQDGATASQTVFNPADVELDEITDAVVDAIDRHKPKRMMLDSVSELAVLVESPYQFRRQLLRIKRKLSESHCTSLLSAGEVERDAAWLGAFVYGLIELSMTTPTYGRSFRQLRVTKMGATDYLTGQHDYRIRTGGIELYPRLEQPTCEIAGELPLLSSGNRQLDAMLGGGMEPGTACLITGTTGSGKTTLASLYVQAAAERGEGCAIFCFDERRRTFIHRAEQLEMSIPRHIEAGTIRLWDYSVGEVTPGEFAQTVQRAVEDDSARVIVIDSVTGYLNAMTDRQLLISQLHDLLGYLGHHGVLTLLIVASHELSGALSAEIDPSYLADSVILLRHFETCGQRRRCIAVLKKRHGSHESMIREMQIEPGGLRIGSQLSEFSGILIGEPTYHGTTEALLESTRPTPTTGADDAA